MPRGSAEYLKRDSLVPPNLSLLNLNVGSPGSPAAPLPSSGCAVVRSQHAQAASQDTRDHTSDASSVGILTMTPGART